jgi:hypothetical protein
MSSEWMKVMLEEISRKKADGEQARAEQRRREHERESLAQAAQREASGPDVESPRQAERASDEQPAPGGSGAGRARG